MHTVELLDEALATARRLNYGIREDWLGGQGSGGCQLRGRKWLFLDLAQTPAEKLGAVVNVLRDDPMLPTLPLSPTLAHLLAVRKSA